MIDGSSNYIWHSLHVIYKMVLEKGQADIVLLGRELLRNPYFALQAGAEYPEQYLRGKTER